MVPQWSLCTLYRCTKFCTRAVGVYIPGWVFIVCYTCAFDPFSLMFHGKQSLFQLLHFGIELTTS